MLCASQVKFLQYIQCYSTWCINLKLHGNTTIIMILNKLAYSWLKQLWSCKSEKGELSEREAIRLAKKLDPSITEQFAKRRVAVLFD